MTEVAERIAAEERATPAIACGTCGGNWLVGAPEQHHAGCTQTPPRQMGVSCLLTLCALLTEYRDTHKGALFQHAEFVRYYAEREALERSR